MAKTCGPRPDVHALRHARPILQTLLLLVALAIVLHGFWGPQIAPRNLATVLTWVHYRGLLILTLLAIGNAFCMGCPMILVRDAGRRLVHPALRWPRALRTKWIAIGLLVAVLLAYELFDLWDLPQGTAWLVLGYFVAALVVDVVFAGATFCKYLCPVGQFSFVASTISPTELRVRHDAVCRSCQTVDCIKGRRDVAQPARVIQRGCELALFQPVKVGNLDCTLCLDCVSACPHDNIALTWRVPGEELIDPRRRSGIGKLFKRPDIAALVVVFTFGAMLNAFAMTRPAAAAGEWVGRALGSSSEPLILIAIFAIALVVVPALLVGGAAAASALIAGAPIRPALLRFAHALVPLAVGMWAAHYAFHLLTGVLTVVPVTQSAAIDAFGAPLLGPPLWLWAGLQPGFVFPIQLGLLALGTIGSVTVAFRIASLDHPSRPVAAGIPWAALTVLLAAACVWILAQPMDMRGLGVA
jgi:ferredoxin